MLAAEGRLVPLVQQTLAAAAVPVGMIIPAIMQAVMAARVL